MGRTGRTAVDAVVKVLREDREGLSVREISDRSGVQGVTVRTVLWPLVATGVVEKLGERRVYRYRLVRRPAPVE